MPSDTVSLADYERHFARMADAGVRAYVDGAAADGFTQRNNRAAFDNLYLLPRVLTDLTGATAATTLFGMALDYPILIAPTAYHKLVHPEGEVATAVAAALARTVMTVSTQASVSLEDIAAAAHAPLWFQLYAQPRWDDTLTLVRRAEAAGYKALLLTVDAPLSGIRNMEQRAGFRLPEGIRAVNLPDAPASVRPVHPGSPVFQGMLNDAPCWSTLERLCGATSLPVLVKGILMPEDAELAIGAGCAGIVVSNHGGRVLDTVPPAMAVLPLVAARVAGRVPVLVDGGIRRGTDIVMAIALGAAAVLIGRPVLHALAVGGVEGVAHMLTVLQTELEAAMALTGRARLKDIDPTILMARNGGCAYAPR
ncbi:alpha-hydroxy acid oxidase [Xanthobacter oligotrophicus]|uniref:Alpha-hydroxy acid oxidase n=1 Tax=Xanthobacter oligotrophicus TaxID=2607286 RepID=A0ABW7A286_9HYPH